MDGFAWTRSLPDFFERFLDPYVVVNLLYDYATPIAREFEAKLVRQPDPLSVFLNELDEVLPGFLRVSIYVEQYAGIEAEPPLLPQLAQLVSR